MSNQIILTHKNFYDQIIYDFQTTSYYIYFFQHLNRLNQILIVNSKKVCLLGKSFQVFIKQTKLQRFAVVRNMQRNLKQNLNPFSQQQNIIKVIQNFKNKLQFDRQKLKKNLQRLINCQGSPPKKEAGLDYSKLQIQSQKIQRWITQKLLQLQKLKEKQKLKIQQSQPAVYIQKIVGQLILMKQQQYKQKKFLLIERKKPIVETNLETILVQSSKQFDFLKDQQKINYKDIFQGDSFNDCYLIASIISTAANHKNLISSMFTYQNNNQIIVQLFLSGKKYKVKTSPSVLITNKHETNKYNSFTKNSNQLYPHLIQKAFACILQRYDRIEMQYNQLGLSLLCKGAPVFKYNNCEVNFEKIEQFLKKKYIMTCETFCQKINPEITVRHSYSIINILQINKYKILKIRNPNRTKNLIIVQNEQTKKIIEQEYCIDEESIIFLDYNSFKKNILSICVAKYIQNYQVQSFLSYKKQVNQKQDIVKLKFIVDSSNSGLLFLTLYQMDHCRYNTKIYSKSPSTLFIMKQEGKTLVNVASCHQLQNQQKDNNLQLDLKPGTYYAIFTAFFPLIECQLVFCIYSRKNGNSLKRVDYQFEIMKYFNNYLKKQQKIKITNTLNIKGCIIGIYLNMQDGIGLIEFKISEQSQLNLKKRYEIILINEKRCYFVNSNTFNAFQNKIFYFIPITTLSINDISFKEITKSEQ